MKSIDIKSLIIGALLTSTIFLGVAASGGGSSKVTYEYAWLRTEYALGTGAELKRWPYDNGLGREKGSEWGDVIFSATYANLAAKEGWEIDPSGITHRIKGTLRTHTFVLIRRPKK
jgi:hypothetical protein